MANGSDYRLGSIWLVSFDPARGTEIKKTRPALIISGTLFNQQRSKITVLPITSVKVNDARLSPAVTLVLASKENGLSVNSLIVCVDPMTFDKRRFIKNLGYLESEYLTRSQTILLRYLSLG
jgi:mRNA interferase MazF